MGLFWKFSFYFLSFYLEVLAFVLMALSFLGRHSLLEPCSSPSAVVVSLNNISSFSQVRQDSDLPYDYHIAGMRGAYHHTPGLLVEMRLGKFLSMLSLNHNALNISIPSS
jgi:hypothetical protein